jgi:hypothetical protein
MKKEIFAFVVIAIMSLLKNQCFYKTSTYWDGFRVNKTASIQLNDPIIESYFNRTSFKKYNPDVIIRNSNTEKLTLQNGVQLIKIEVENAGFNNLCIVAYKDGFISYFVNSLKDDVELFSIDKILVSTINVRDYKLSISPDQSFSGQSSLGGGNSGASSINASVFASCMDNCEADFCSTFAGWWSWNFGGGMAVAAIACKGFAMGWWLSPACNQ